MNIGEQILVWLLVLPFVALLSVIVESVGENIRRKRYERQRAEMERVINKNGRRLAAQLKNRPSKPVGRGYDSPEVFRKDALIRIRKLEAEIAADYGQSVSDKSKARKQEG